MRDSLANLHCFAFESITPDAATSPNASNLADTTPTVHCVAIEVVTSNQAARYRIDGAADPTTAVGALVPAAQSRFVWGKDNCDRLRIINVVAGGVVSLLYYR